MNHKHSFSNRLNPRAKLYIGCKLKISCLSTFGWSSAYGSCTRMSLTWYIDNAFSTRHFSDLPSARYYLPSKVEFVINQHLFGSILNPARFFFLNLTRVARHVSSVISLYTEQTFRVRNVANISFNHKVQQYQRSLSIHVSKESLQRSFSQLSHHMIDAIVKTCNIPDPLSLPSHFHFSIQTADWKVCDDKKIRELFFYSRIFFKIETRYL